MTPRQTEILKFVNNFLQQNIHSPTYQEIRAGLKINSLTSVAQGCKALERRGLITKEKNQHRSIDITQKGIVKLSRSNDIKV
tara:strand:- start:57 stop:302 length:246 start_codon:yes stop_codon:yes gene_type:complete